MEGRELGRLIPTDWKHVEKYGISAVMPETVASVERTLKLPYQYRSKYDQGAEGACVGFGSSWMTSIHNGGFFDARWLYHEAQKVDEWPGENYEGTSVRAAMDILRKVGHRKKWWRFFLNPNLDYGIAANRWATHVDEMRTAISEGKAITIGVNWYSNFDHPVKIGNQNWIGQGDLGRIRGGHCVCLYGASDKLQAFRMVNNWGTAYPLVLLPYEVMQRLLNEEGEATIITDR